MPEKVTSKSSDSQAHDSSEEIKEALYEEAVERLKQNRDAAAPYELPNSKLGMDSGGNMNMQDFFSTRMELMKRTQATLKRTAALAAFVPDFILQDEGQKVPYQTSLDGVVVIADVSGFTALTEKYSLKGKGGTDQLTKTLSNYMGPLAECILRAGGDIIKYAGDAILAVWRVSDRSQYYPELQRVVDCTLYIQEKYGSYDTDVGITIRVKLGIGAGRIFECGVGNQEYHHFVCFGPGVMSASEAEHHCESGEVIMQLAAWELCNPIHFNYAIKDAGFVRITEIFTFVNPELRGRPKVVFGKQALALPSPDQIRPSVVIALEKKTEIQLRHYVIPPVLKKLDDDMPLEYLNESRQTSICFIKLEIRPFESSASFVDNMLYIVQTAFKHIYKTGLIMGGCLTKIIMFDKGLTYLVVFGLPGYLHDNQSANALKFSYRVKALLHAIKYVSEVSLGVTSGSTYCGVLGHEKRQEYTVIGRKVNKAARLMCYYPGKVTCDQDTLYHSKLPVHHFSLMEAKELKGIKDVGNIYEYLSSETTEDQSVKRFDYPMLGRDSEFRYFSAILDAVEAEFSRFLQAHRVQDVVYDLRTTKEVQAAGLWILVFESDIGMGKSRLLAACILEAERRGIKVFSVTMNMMLGTQGLASVRSLLLQAFGMEDMRTSQEREEHLRRTVGDDADLAAGLCLLNALLGLKFPMHPRYANAEMNSRHVLSMHILNVLIRHFYPESLLLIVVDDAHQMEPICWEYILHMSRTPAVLALLSIRRNAAGAPRLPEAITKVVYHNKNVKSIRLNGLETNLCLPLASQMLEVAGVPVELERILINKSQGNPAWIEQVLSEMLRTGLIKILHYDLREASRRNMRLSTVDLKYITRLEYSKTAKNKAYAWHSEDVTETSSHDNLFDDGGEYVNIHQAHDAVRVQKEMIRPETRMCVVKSDTNISSAPIPGTLKEMLLDAFDELNNSEQMLLKSASALGFRFCRAMLIELVPLYEMNARKYQNGLRRLMELKLIKCASAPHKTEVVSATEVNCFCRITKEDMLMDLDGDRDPKRSVDDVAKPKYYRCKYMQFSKDNLLDVVYELMTEDQRKELHLKAARYLSSSMILCRVCGGDDTAYTLGFTLKGADIGGDHEEALRTAAVQIRRKPLFQGGKNSRRSTGATSTGSEPLAMSSRRIKSRGRGSSGASNSNRIDSIKKIYQTSGTKVGGIEVEILKTVEKFEKLQKERERLKWPCAKGPNSGKKRRMEKRAEAREFELQIKLLEKMDEEQEMGGGDEARDGQRYDVRSLAVSTQGRQQMVGAMGGARRDVVDFRGCGCNNIQAKIAIDLVKHYRIAEKFGKCLINLMAASETAIAIGNSTQALVHLEDAVALMHALDTLELTPPKPDDQDDTVVNFAQVNIQMEFLTGLSYFELGVQHKARDYFCRSLRRYGIDVPSDEEKVKRNAAIVKASSKLWRRHNCPCLAEKMSGKKGNEKQTNEVSGSMDMKLRIFSYLHTLFKAERKMESALLISLWQLIAAQDISGAYQDVLPAYCNMMDMYSAMSNHKQASNYEKYALRLIRTSFGSDDSQNALGIYTSANVFLTISAIRTLRGDLHSAVDAAYLALRIASTMHDNALATQVFPRLVSSLLFSLRISEVIECLQRLWYTAEEEDDWSGVAMYYTLCLELLLNTAYPMEPFCTCENFVISSDWNADTQMFRTYEVQYHIEASLALWHSRYSRWEGAMKWKAQAELHKPKVTSYLSVGGELKLLECELIFVNHYLDSKRYQHFAKARNAAKSYMRSLQKSTVSAPVFLPRFLHLMGYYCRIRSRNLESDKHLKKAEEVAKEHGNELEREWISHNRNVWNDEAIPSVRFFWLEHTEHHTLDWHQSGTVPWANIMFSLPIPEWQS